MSRSTVVVIGDLHLHQNARQPDRLRSWDQVIGEGLGLQDLAAWLLLGDLFHARSSIADRNEAAPRLQRMADRAPVILLAGNHDAPGDLTILGELRARWPIYVITVPQTVRVRCATSAFASIFCLPYPHRAGLVAAGLAPAEIPQAARGPLEDVIDQAVAELATARKAGDITIAIGHVTVAGAVSSSGQPQIGQEIELSPALIDKFHPAPVFLGHIHRAQEIGAKATAEYVGSLCRMDWGEVEEKHYVQITFAPAGWGGHHGDGPYANDGAWDYDLRHCPIDVPPMWHVEGELTRDGFRGDVKRGPGGETLEAPTSWAGCEVRVRYRFKASERAALDDRVVAEGFAGAARLHLDPVAVPDRGLRAPAVALAATLADKVRAWCEANGETASAGVLDKLARLQQQDAQAVLTDLAGRLQDAERAATGRPADPDPATVPLQEALP